MSYEDFVVLVFDDESTKWFMPIHQNSQRSCNRINKIWTLKKEDHSVDTKCHSVDYSREIKRKSMKTVDDKSAKCLMSIYQIGQRSDNRTTKIWTLKQENHSVDTKCQSFGYSWKIQRKSTNMFCFRFLHCFSLFSTCFSSESGLFFL